MLYIPSRVYPVGCQFTSCLIAFIHMKHIFLAVPAKYSMRCRGRQEQSDSLCRLCTGTCR